MYTPSDYLSTDRSGREFTYIGAKRSVIGTTFWLWIPLDNVPLATYHAHEEKQFHYLYLIDNDHA